MGAPWGATALLTQTVQQRYMFTLVPVLLDVWTAERTPTIAACSRLESGIESVDWLIGWTGLFPCVSTCIHNLPRSCNVSTLKQ